MKTNLKKLIILILIFSPVLRLQAQGYIVTNGVIGGTSGNSFILSVLQNPTNGNNTGFFLIPQGKTQPTISTNTFSFDPFLDEGVRTFLVSSNDSISLQPILANSYPELTYPNTYVFANRSPFYVGLYTGETLSQNGIYNDPLFGWAQLVNDNGVIQFLGGALEYGGGGIYAGTQTIIPVPEPSTLGLLALGSLLFGLHRSRK